MERIGFFGGCFNPPNTLHIEMANELIKNKKVDKVVYIPVNDFYKKQGLIEAKHRYNMLKLAIKSYKNIQVSDIEIKINKALYAIDAFEIIQNSELINKENNDEIYFIMGSDNFKKMPNWKNYNKIKDRYKFIVIDRNNNDITSTKIREMISKNDANVKKYLNNDVYEYIIKNKLYF